MCDNTSSLLEVPIPLCGSSMQGVLGRAWVHLAASRTPHNNTACLLELKELNEELEELNYKLGGL